MASAAAASAAACSSTSIEATAKSDTVSKLPNTFSFCAADASALIATLRASALADKSNPSDVSVATISASCAFVNSVTKASTLAESAAALIA